MNSKTFYGSSAGGDNKKNTNGEKDKTSKKDKKERANAGQGCKSRRLPSLKGTESSPNAARGRFQSNQGGRGRSAGSNGTRKSKGSNGSNKCSKGKGRGRSADKNWRRPKSKSKAPRRSLQSKSSGGERFERAGPAFQPRGQKAGAKQEFTPSMVTITAQCRFAGTPTEVDTSHVAARGNTRASARSGSDTIPTVTHSVERRIARPHSQTS